MLPVSKSGSPAVCDKTCRRVIRFQVSGVFSIYTESGSSSFSLPSSRSISTAVAVKSLLIEPIS
jgi:hypothetical protein